MGLVKGRASSLDTFGSIRLFINEMFKREAHDSGIAAH
jgi:hypothetical protein